MKTGDKLALVTLATYCLKDENNSREDNSFLIGMLWGLAISVLLGIGCYIHLRIQGLV